MECSITGTKLEDKVRSSKIRDLTGTKNIKYIIKKLKLKYVGHIKRNFLKDIVKISIKRYLKIAQILVIVYPKFSENFLFFLEFPQIFIKI